MLEKLVIENAMHTTRIVLGEHKELLQAQVILDESRKVIKDTDVNKVFDETYSHETHESEIDYDDYLSIFCISN